MVGTLQPLVGSARLEDEAGGTWYCKAQPRLLLQGTWHRVERGKARPGGTKLEPRKIEPSVQQTAHDSAQLAQAIRRCTSMLDKERLLRTWPQDPEIPAHEVRSANCLEVEGLTQLRVRLQDWRAQPIRPQLKTSRRYISLPPSWRKL